MMFGNLLNRALTIIPKQKFLYIKFIDTRVNDIGIKQDFYDRPIEAVGSVQAIQTSMYEKMGLDFSKKYIKVLCSLDVRNFDKNNVYKTSQHSFLDHNQEQVSPDKIIWNNKEYLVENITDWYAQDGWKRIIAVESKQGVEKQC